MLSDDERMIVDAAEKYGKDVLLPLAAAMDDGEYWPNDLFEKLGSDGYLGITAPESYGGGRP